MLWYIQYGLIKNKEKKAVNATCNGKYLGRQSNNNEMQRTKYTLKDECVVCWTIAIK